MCITNHNSAPLSPPLHPSPPHTAPPSPPTAPLSPHTACSPPQMAAGLEYLHQNRIVHLDIKSGNILVWRFPSANLTLPDRAQRAGDVDLRLTDYGISRLSGYHGGVRLDGPVGTPGYTAPELNHCKGLEISAEKVSGERWQVGGAEWDGSGRWSVRVVVGLACASVLSPLVLRAHTTIHSFLFPLLSFTSSALRVMCSPLG